MHKFRIVYELDNPTKDQVAQAQRLHEIFSAILKERVRQDKKYGPVVIAPVVSGLDLPLEQGPGGHEIPGWMLVLEKELDEAKDACIHGGHQTAKGRNHARTEVLQVAAVCVAALEQHGVQEPVTDGRLGGE